MQTYMSVFFFLIGKAKIVFFLLIGKAIVLTKRPAYKCLQDIYKHTCLKCKVFFIQIPCKDMLSIQNI